MWVKLRHIKRIGFTLVLLLIVSIILELTSSLIFALKQQDFYSDYYSANKSGIVKIVDNYDTSNTDIFDFLDEPEALEKLETMYDWLINNKIIKYYEIATQSIEFIGNYEKSLNLVVNDDISNINQEVLNGEVITPLKSLQIGNKTFDLLNIDKYVINGRSFIENDFFLMEGEPIPLILGNEYAKSNFNLDDEIEFFYLGEKFKGKVIGFLTEKAKIPTIFEFDELDNYIIIPSFNFNENINKNTNLMKVNYLLKTQGFMFYDNIDSYKKSTEELSNLATIIGLNYSNTKKTGFLNEKIKISEKQSIVLISISFIISIILLYFNLNKIKDYINEVDILHINIILSSFIPINIIFTNVICSVLIKNNFWHEIFTMYKSNLAVYNAILLILYTILNNIIYKNKKSSIFN